MFKEYCLAGWGFEKSNYLINYNIRSYVSLWFHYGKLHAVLPELILTWSSPRRQDAYEYPMEDNKAPSLSPHQLQVQSRWRQVQYRQGQYRQAQSMQGQSRHGQWRQGQSRQGQSHKTNGLAPLSFDLSFDLSLSLRIFVDWISFYASVWGLGLGEREGSSN